MDDEVLRKCAPRKWKDTLLLLRHPREDEGCGTGDAHPDAFEDFCTGPFWFVSFSANCRVDSAPNVGS